MDEHFLSLGKGSRLFSEKNLYQDKAEVPAAVLYYKVRRKYNNFPEHIRIFSRIWLFRLPEYVWKRQEK